MKIQSPWMGRIKGSAGNMTGCKVYDKNVMRAKAFEVSNPRTTAQVTQRDFFAKLTALCSDFTAEQLRCLFPQKPKAMSRRNMLTSQIAENYSVAGKTKSINFATIDTLGNASVMDFGTTACDWDDGHVAVALDDAVIANPTLEDYYFIVAIVNVTKGQIHLTWDGLKVSVGNITVTVPSNWESTDVFHAIPFITNTKTAPTGFGTLSVMKRPARRND